MFYTFFLFCVMYMTSSGLIICDCSNVESQPKQKAVAQKPAKTVTAYTPRALKGFEK